MSGSSRILAVVDTNLVVSSVISKRGAPYQLIQALYAGRFRIAVTNGIRAEYEDVLSRPFLARFGDVAESDITAFLRFLDKRSLLISPLRRSSAAARPRSERQLPSQGGLGR